MLALDPAAALMEVLELDLDKPEMALLEGFLLNSEVDGLTVAVGVELL